MPSRTPRQARAMKAACHGKARRGGIPRKVACKFVRADAGGRRKPKRKRK